MINRPLLAMSLAVLLSSSSVTMAAAKPKANPADYPLTVHVKVSKFGRPHEVAELEQVLDVTIDGKRYRLSANAIIADVHGIGGLHYGLLPVGDYKARLVPQPSRTPAYLIFDQYELLLPDGRTLNCTVSGLYEDRNP